MPELPDVVNYCRALERLVVGQTLEKIQLASPFLLRTVDPPLSVFHGKRLVSVSREAKQIVLEFDSGEKLLIHLMIAGRLRWRDSGAKVPKTNLQASFQFDKGTLLFTEAGKKKRARLYALPAGAGRLPGRSGEVRDWSRVGSSLLMCPQMIQTVLQGGEPFKLADHG